METTKHSFGVSSDDMKLIHQLQKMLEKERGKVSRVAVVREALREFHKLLLNGKDGAR
jgi:hypothetical protein